MNLYKILPALLILSLLAACSSDKENDVYTTLPFSLSIYQVAMTIEGGEQEVNVSSGGAWQSSIHCDWMMDGLQSSREKKKKELPLCNRL